MKKVFRLISTYHENSKSVYRSSAERKKKKKNNNNMWQYLLGNSKITAEALFLFISVCLIGSLNH